MPMPWRIIRTVSTFLDRVAVAAPAQVQPPLCAPACLRHRNSGQLLTAAPRVGGARSAACQSDHLRASTTQPIGVVLPMQPWCAPTCCAAPSPVAVRRAALRRLPSQRNHAAASAPFFSCRSFWFFRPYRASWPCGGLPWRPGAGGERSTMSCAISPRA